MRIKIISLNPFLCLFIDCWCHYSFIHCKHEIIFHGLQWMKMIMVNTHMFYYNIVFVRTVLRTGSQLAF
jgi:hypothetical protein